MSWKMKLKFWLLYIIEIVRFRRYVFERKKIENEILYFQLLLITDHQSIALRNKLFSKSSWNMLMGSFCSFEYFHSCNSFVFQWKSFTTFDQIQKVSRTSYSELHSTVASRCAILARESYFTPGH